MPVLFAHSTSWTRSAKLSQSQLQHVEGNTQTTYDRDQSETYLNHPKPDSQDPIYLAKSIKKQHLAASIGCHRLRSDEAYAIIRCGVDSEIFKSFKQELVIYPRYEKSTEDKKPEKAAASPLVLSFVLLVGAVAYL
ncbi:Uncharacterized protein SCF082_LOCUS39576 [Durusdinium trenchii]|uniref:Uncharacterized protein n=1 Tax=Durusdinium trenchii TaxID=1381693 RepID=A0ABP0Q6P5_9DINO